MNRDIGALEKETPSKKRLEGEKKEGKEISLGVWIRDVGQGKCSHSILKRNRA
jgi:hypothetical protein